MIRKTSARNSKKRSNPYYADVFDSKGKYQYHDFFDSQKDAEHWAQKESRGGLTVTVHLGSRSDYTLSAWRDGKRAKVPSKNPAKFDKCVAKVKKSMKKSKRPGNAYAICTAAGKNKKNPPTPQQERLYRAAQKADDDFQAALEKAYKSKAGDMRYQTSKQTPAIRKLGKQMQRLAAAYIRSVRKGREKNPASYRGKSVRDLETMRKYAMARAYDNDWMVRYDGRRDVEAIDKALKAARKREAKAGISTSQNRKNPTGHIRQGSAEATIEKTGGKYLVTIKSFGKAVLRKTFASLKAALAHARINVQRVAQNPDSAIDLIPGGSTVAAYGKAGHRVLKGVTKLGKQTLKKLKGFATGKRRKNPIELAQQRVEEFTGFPSTEIMELAPRKHIHENLAGLAQFVAFNLVDADGKELPPLMAPGMKYTGDPKEILFSFKGEPKGDWDFDARTPADKIVWLTSSEKTDYKIDGKPVQVKQQLFLSGGDQSLDEKGMRYLRLEPRDLHDNTFVGTIVRVWYWTRKTFEAKGKEKVWFFHDFGKEGSMGRCPILIYHPLDPGFEIAGGRYYVALPRKDLKGVRGGPVSPGIVG